MPTPHASSCPRCHRPNGPPCAFVPITRPAPAWLLAYRCSECDEEWTVKQAWSGRSGRLAHGMEDPTPTGTPAASRGVAMQDAIARCQHALAQRPTRQSIDREDRVREPDPKV
jgi:hypothetical protein